MEEFLKYILRQLLEFPDEIVLTRLDSSPRKLAYKLQVRREDVGRVIGRHGHTIKAIRALLGAAAARQGMKVLLHVEEEGGQIAEADAAADAHGDPAYPDQPAAQPAPGIGGEPES